MQLTNGSALFCDLDKTLLYFLTCFPHLWNEEKTLFSPRWGEQFWRIPVLWDPWQGAIEMNETPVVLLGFRCQRTLKEQPACIFSWRTSKTPSILNIDPSRVFPYGFEACTGSSAKSQHWCFWRSRRAFWQSAGCAELQAATGARDLWFTIALSPLLHIASLGFFVRVLFLHVKTTTYIPEWLSPKLWI